MQARFASGTAGREEEGEEEEEEEEREGGAWRSRRSEVGNRRPRMLPPALAPAKSGTSEPSPTKLEFHFNFF